jgi:hypothetical protein
MADIQLQGSGQAPHADPLNGERTDQPNRAPISKRASDHHPLGMFQQTIRRLM